MREDAFLKQNNAPRLLLLLDVFFVVFYFIALIFFFQKGALWLWGLLMFGEAFHVWQVLTFIGTVWETESGAPRDPWFAPDVDVLVPVAGEPVEVVERTIRAAQRMRYAGKVKIFILN